MIKKRIRSKKYLTNTLSYHTIMVLNKKGFKTMPDKFQIVKGNSLELLSSYTSNSFDYVFTSPPYNRKRNDKYNAYDDNQLNYYEMLCTLIDNSVRIAKDYVFINLQKNYYNKQDIFKVIGKYANEIIDIIIWNKSNPMPASGKHITNSYEFVLVLSKSHKSLEANSTYTKNLITTPVYSNNPYKKIHRAVMSDVFCNTFFDKFIKPQSSILDPFSGLATTGEACLTHNCTYTGIELSQLYFDESIKRLLNIEKQIRNRE